MPWRRVMHGARLLGVIWVLGSAAGAAQADAAASGIAEVEARVRAAEELTGTFTQRREIDSLPFPLLSTGRFALLSDAGLYWHVLSPAESALRVRQGRVDERVGQGAWAPVELGATAQRLTGQLLTDWVAGRFRRLDAMFDVMVQLDDQGWTVQLSPRDAAVASVIQQVRLRGDQFVREIRIKHVNGEATEIELTPAPDRPLTESERGVLVD
ncbi:outer membrane lipoprotein carrier protein LolA [Abyssibacter profundi]|uniref:Outer membrane lipoprotein carrier protein LolA n=1 Tax=Abyssibacter profundi TaxID=2182787 RepID=A0A363UJ90_9GAMM|nr:outer membrane lipoprotein carrier protein LolA [Abyssibacter profundi]PWN55493.1 hypothetical protein DEH80_11920 [Abyssibacter profundi]